MPPPTQDHVLVRSAAAGDRSAFGALVERYGSQLQCALEGRLRDPEAAADLAQETWVRVARGLAGFHVGQRFRPWLFAVGFNALRDHARRRGARAEATSSRMVEGEHISPDGQGGLRELEEREAIRLALDEVEEPFQTAVRLVDVLGLDYAEAAEGLGCAEGTVKSRVSRGRRAFRASYARLVGETPTGQDETKERGTEPASSNGL